VAVIAEVFMTSQRRAALAFLIVLAFAAVGFSRDDVNKILPIYLDEGILKQDPFAALDQDGVGQLVKIATERGRKTRPDLKVGICGQLGGEPASIEFCHKSG